MLLLLLLPTRDLYIYIYGIYQIIVVMLSDIVQLLYCIKWPITGISKSTRIIIFMRNLQFCRSYKSALHVLLNVSRVYTFFMSRDRHNPIFYTSIVVIAVNFIVNLIKTLNSLKTHPCQPLPYIVYINKGKTILFFVLLVFTYLKLFHYFELISTCLFYIFGHRPCESILRQFQLLKKLLSFFP